MFSSLIHSVAVVFCSGLLTRTRRILKKAPPRGLQRLKAVHALRSDQPKSGPHPLGGPFLVLFFSCARPRARERGAFMSTAQLLLNELN